MDATVPDFVAYYKPLDASRPGNDQTAIDKAEKNLELSLKKILKETEIKEVKRLL